MTAQTSEMLQHPDYSHRVFFADSIGCLRCTQAPGPPLPEGYAGPSIHTVILPGFRSHSDQAVQKMAQGTLANDTFVIALARKSGSVDLVQIHDVVAETSSASGPSVTATVLCTIHEPRMKAGIQRWVGLAVATDGVYSCTSAGAFRFTPITSDSQNILGTPVTLELPGPLQHLTFQPPTNPTHFSYGGEEIPVSLWDISVALSEQPPQNTAADESTESINTENLTGKMKKRKRQAEARAKARELMWGEVWRSRNLPNDMLQLPQRASITQVAIVQLDSSKDAASDTDSDNGSAIPADTTLVVGTKDGLIRVYEPSKSRKHVREHRIVHAGQGSIKTMANGLSPGELFVADNSGRLFAVDWRTGVTQYTYKDMTGAITSICPLATPRGAPLVLSTSQDKLVRMHSTVPPVEAPRAEAKSKQRGQTLWTTFASSANSAPSTYITASAWDGKVPLVRKTKSAAANADGDNDEDDDGDDDDDNDDDEVWSKMKEVGAKKGNTVDEEQDDESEQEERPKRTKT